MWGALNLVSQNVVGVSVEEIGNRATTLLEKIDSSMGIDLNQTEGDDDGGGEAVASMQEKNPSDAIGVVVRLKREHTKQLEELSGSNKVLQTELARLEAENESMKQRLESSSSKSSSSSSSNSRSSSSDSSDSSDSSETTTGESSIALENVALKSQAKDMNEKINDLQNEQDNMIEMITAARSSLAERAEFIVQLQQDIASLQSQQESASNLQTQLDGKTEEIADLQSQLSSLESLSNDIEEQRLSETASLQQQLTDMLAKTSEEAAASKEQIAALELEKEQLSTVMAANEESLRAELAAMEQSIDSAQDRLRQSTQSSQSQASEEATLWQSRIAALEIETGELTTALTATELSLKGERDQNFQASKEAASLKTQIAALEKERDEEAKGKVAAMEELKVEMDRVRSQTSEESTAAKMQIVTLESEKEQLSTVLAGMEAEKGGLVSTHESMKREMDRVTSAASEQAAVAKEQIAALESEKEQLSTVLAGMEESLRAELEGDNDDVLNRLLSRLSSNLKELERT
jgi:chromosome segregation ATPase